MAKIISPFTVPRRGRVREQIVQRYAKLKRARKDLLIEELIGDEMMAPDEVTEFRPGNES